MSNMQATMCALLGRIPTLVELASLTNKLLYATTPSNKLHYANDYQARRLKLQKN